MISKTQEIPREQLVSFLGSNFIAVLSTADDNKPTASPVVYVVDEDLNFYFVTNIDTYKAKNILKNPNVSMCIWEFSNMSVQLDGTATKVEDEAKQEWVIEKFSDAATKDPNFWAPIFRIKRGDYAVFKVKPTWLRALDLSRNTVRSKESPYTEVI